MDPVTLGLIGTAVSAVGMLSNAAAQSNAAEYNAAVARQNAEIMNQQGAAAAEAQSREARAKIGLMSANYAASGVDVGSGSPLDVLAESAAMAKLDNLTTKYNYSLKATGYQNSATLDTMNANNAMTSGFLSAAGTALGGAAKSLAYKNTGNPLPDTLTYGSSSNPGTTGTSAFLS